MSDGESESGQYDNLIGVSAVLVVGLGLLWYFDEFGVVLGGFKWLLTTIMASVISSILSTVILVIGAIVVLVIGKTYLSRKK